MVGIYRFVFRIYDGILPIDGSLCQTLQHSLREDITDDSSRLRRPHRLIPYWRIHSIPMRAVITLIAER